MAYFLKPQIKRKLIYQPKLFNSKFQEL
jgi:hypothetical protein